MRCLLVLGILLLCACGTGGGYDDVDESQPPPTVTEPEPEPVWENKYYWPFQCPDVKDINTFYQEVTEDNGYPARTIPTDTVVRLTKGSEGFREPLKKCVEALNWALPDEYSLRVGDTIVSASHHTTPGYGEIHVGVHQELIERAWEEIHPLISALAYPGYVVLSDYTRTIPVKDQADTICHELMHVLGFWGHPNDWDWSKNDYSSAFPYPSILGSPGGCGRERTHFSPEGVLRDDGINSGLYVEGYSLPVDCLGIPIHDWPESGEWVEYQSLFGPHYLLTPMDAMALRKLYGGNDIEKWIKEQRLAPSDCP